LASKDSHPQISPMAQISTRKLERAFTQRVCRACCACRSLWLDVTSSKSGMHSMPYGTTELVKVIGE
jgi:hypothetical protein